MSTVFVNREQTAKPTTGDLNQESIDRAFKNQPRESNLRYAYEGHEIVLLSGKFTARCGVIARRIEEESLWLTDIERTLLDIAVRPTYGSGVSNVLGAFEKARGAADPEKLSSYLAKLRYVYPYEQAIGFYLSRAGYSPNVLKQFDKPKRFTFYLGHSLTHLELDKTWQIMAPRELVRHTHTSP
jgi:hypothetical protein